MPGPDSTIEPRTTRARARSIVVAAASIFLLPAAVQADDQPLFTLDEGVWATFYDVPSRRFRTIRDAFVRRNFEAAARDLKVSIGFISIEGSRAVEELVPPMQENLARLEYILANLDGAAISVGDLDASFARSHWLLAQHYLVLARLARDGGRHRNAGHYLWATAHHLERSVIWSDAKVDRKTLNALESIRDMAEELRSTDKPEKVYRNRPVAKATQTLIDIGEHIDRKVWTRERLTDTN